MSSVDQLNLKPNLVNIPALLGCLAIGVNTIFFQIQPAQAIQSFPQLAADDVNGRDAHSGIIKGHDSLLTANDGSIVTQQQFDSLARLSYKKITEGTICEDDNALLTIWNSIFRKGGATRADAWGHIQRLTVFAFPKGDVCNVKVLEGIMNNQQAQLTYSKNTQDKEYFTLTWYNSKGEKKFHIFGVEEVEGFVSR